MNRLPDPTCLSPRLESWDQVMPTSRASAEIKHVRDKIVTSRHKHSRSAACLATSSRHNTYIYQTYQTSSLAERSGRTSWPGHGLSLLP